MRLVSVSVEWRAADPWSVSHTRAETASVLCLTPSADILLIQPSDFLLRISFFLRVLCKNLMVGGLAILNLERFSFLTVTSPISQILGIAKGFNVLYYSRNSRRLLGFFFLARLLLAVTSASVATVFFSSCIYVWRHK